MVNNYNIKINSMQLKHNILHTIYYTDEKDYQICSNEQEFMFPSI